MNESNMNWGTFKKSRLGEKQEREREREREMGTYGGEKEVNDSLFSLCPHKSHNSSNLLYIPFVKKKEKILKNYSILTLTWVLLPQPVSPLMTMTRFLLIAFSKVLSSLAAGRRLRTSKERERERKKKKRERKRRRKTV